ncbi:MAG: MATE family efflux transporter [Clostridiales bacterium]|nr:MATE family efflux transporter [Clostridiales bacterium]
MQMRKAIKDDIFYSQIFKLVLPIVIQNLLSAAVSSADVVMLNYVGQSSISAVSLASQYANILFMVFYGLGTGATMLCAQYYGKGDMQAIQVVEGIAMRFSMLIAICFAGMALLFPEGMMRIFTSDTELITIGASYLRFMSVSYLCWGITEVYLAVLRSIGRVVVSTTMNILAFSLNILLNAVFIFGLFGMPKLGAMGVAIATSLSRLIELFACFMVSGLSKDIKLDFRYLFVKNRALFSDFVRLSLPALGNDISWSVAFSMYSVILGHLGSDVVAANSFVVVVRNFGTILCFGMASAGGILLGNMIGENRLEEARVGAKKLMKLTVITGAIGGGIVLAVTPFVLQHAALSEQAMHYLKYMLIINTYYVMGTAVNTTLIAGVFRAGGDSRFGFICDTIDMWCYAVPLGFLAAFVLKLPVMWVYFLLCTDEFVKWPWVIKHYRSGKWLNNITRDNLFQEKDS